MHVDEGVVESHPIPDMTDQIRYSHDERGNDRRDVKELESLIVAPVGSTLDGYEIGGESRLTDDFEEGGDPPIPIGIQSTDQIENLEEIDEYFDDGSGGEVSTISCLVPTRSRRDRRCSSNEKSKNSNGDHDEDDQNDHIRADRQTPCTRLTIFSKTYFTHRAEWTTISLIAYLSVHIL